MLNKHINKIISAPACTRIRDCIPKKDIENSTPITIENKICSVSISDLKKIFFLNETSLPVKINKPKKKLIVAVSFVSGFILSIFLVFFIEFVRSFKDKND